MFRTSIRLSKHESKVMEITLRGVKINEPPAKIKVWGLIWIKLWIFEEYLKKMYRKSDEHCDRGTVSQNIGNPNYLLLRIDPPGLLTVAQEQTGLHWKQCQNYYKKQITKRLIHVGLKLMQQLRKDPVSYNWWFKIECMWCDERIFR